MNRLSFGHNWSGSKQSSECRSCCKTGYETMTICGDAVVEDWNEQSSLKILVRFAGLY